MGGTEQRTALCAVPGIAPGTGAACSIDLKQDLLNRHAPPATLRRIMIAAARTINTAITATTCGVNGTAHHISVT
jgi:hypothetical protein